MYLERIDEWGTSDTSPGASRAQLDACEEVLGHPVPQELRLILAESDGIVGEYGEGLVWPVERIGRDNVVFRSEPSFRELYMPFDGLVFFADAGNGDQFFVSLRGNNDVYWWNHEDDSRTWVAPTAMRFLERYLTGGLEV